MSLFLPFALGMIVGAVICYFAIKQKYADLAQEEIDSVKAAFSERAEEKNEKEKAEEIVKSENYISQIYSKPSFEIPKKEETNEKTELEVPDTIIIEPDEVGFDEEYGVQTLFFLSDDIMCDEYGITIDDPVDILGSEAVDLLEHDEDEVCVKNDRIKCYYDVVKDLRSYSEFRKNLPRNI